MEFYQDNATLKWIILAVSVIISIGSIYYTNILVDQLKEIFVQKRPPFKTFFL